MGTASWTENECVFDMTRSSHPKRNTRTRNKSTLMNKCWCSIASAFRFQRNSFNELLGSDEWTLFRRRIELYAEREGERERKRERANATICSTMEMLQFRYVLIWIIDVGWSESLKSHAWPWPTVWLRAEQIDVIGFFFFGEYSLKLNWWQNRSKSGLIWSERRNFWR